MRVGMALQGTGGTYSARAPTPQRGAADTGDDQDTPPSVLMLTHHTMHADALCVSCARDGWLLPVEQDVLVVVCTSWFPLLLASTPSCRAYATLWLCLRYQGQPSHC